jgi:methyl coenzyme M reductase subunit C-like uncharacterized protein (methanogenesis marker protein 7)
MRTSHSASVDMMGLARRVGKFPSALLARAERSLINEYAVVVLSGTDYHLP